MTLFKEESTDKDRSYIFPCDCHDAHYLRIHWDEDPQWRGLWIEDVYRPRPWRQKLKDIKSILTNHPVAFTEILLDRETVKSLIGILMDESVATTCPEHGRFCGGPNCCCIDKHKDW